MCLTQFGHVSFGILIISKVDAVNFMWSTHQKIKGILHLGAIGRVTADITATEANTNHQNKKLPGSMGAHRQGRWFKNLLHI